MNLSPSNNFPSSVPPHFLEKKCRGLFNTVEFGAVVSDSWLGSSQTGWAMPVLPHFFIYLFFFPLCPLLCVPGSLNILRKVTRKKGPGLVWNWRKTIVTYWHSIVYPSCSHFASLISLVHQVKHNFFIKLVWQSHIHLWRNLLSIIGVYIFNWKDQL